MPSPQPSAPAVAPTLDPAAPLNFIINAASGSSDGDAKRVVIEDALRAAGRQGDVRFVRPDALAQEARAAAATALATRSAVVAVGGDGTINAVAQAAHAAGCPMGVVPQGTFNYFARTHGFSTEPAEAAQMLMHAVPVPVQVGTVNDRVFLVNASLGLYPVLLEDREAYKSRFGRSRWVAMGAACMTLLRGAMGSLGEADSVESFAFQRMVVQPRLRKIKVAFDGEIARMRTPLEFRVAAQPLYLLKPSLPT